MRNINKALKSTILLVLSLTLLLTLSSCGWLNAFISQLKGELIGNDYIITEYDNFGNPVLQVKGDKITMDGQGFRLRVRRERKNMQKRRIKRGGLEKW